jgi:hypothetical protein
MGTGMSKQTTVLRELRRDFVAAALMLAGVAAIFSLVTAIGRIWGSLL